MITTAVTGIPGPTAPLNKIACLLAARAVKKGRAMETEKRT